MYVALTYIPGGGLLTGFAMRSDPKGFSGLVRITNRLCKSTATDRAHTSTHLASRRSGSTRLLLALGADFLAQRGRCGAHGGTGHSSTQTPSKQEAWKGGAVW